jgi:hypothetical protein
MPLHQSQVCPRTQIQPPYAPIFAFEVLLASSENTLILNTNSFVQGIARYQAKSDTFRRAKAGGESRKPTFTPAARR